MKYKCLAKLDSNNKPKWKNRILSFFNKLMSAIAIGLIILIVMEYSPKLKTFMNDKVLNDNLSFGYFSNLYNKYFGDILPSSNEGTVSVFKEKLTYAAKENYLKGYKLTVTNNYLVPALLDGVVVFIGEKDEYGNVIVVEQSDGVNTIYGNINISNVKLYDHVTKGSFIGEVKDNLLYIVLEKEGEYLDIETYLS